MLETDAQMPFQSGSGKPAAPHAARSRHARMRYHPWRSRAATRSVSLVTGHRLGRYEIVSALGVGGMGEVYRREQIAKLVELDPVSGYANTLLAFSDFTSGRLENAVTHGRQGTQLDPDSYLANWSLTQSLLWNGQYAEVAAVAERGLAMSGRHVWALASLALIDAASDKADEARAVYRELEARSPREYVQPSMLLSAAAAVGDADGAIAIAGRALEERDPLFVMLARSWPGYDRLRSDSRFLDIVRRLHLPGWTPPCKPS
jgi:tetratricopeptide (TPR) repeat protein